MSANEILDQVPNLLQVEFSSRVWVHHGGMEDVLAAFRHQGVNRQFLNIDAGADQGRQLRWEITDAGRLDATVIHQARHLGGTGRRK
jgi:hypothetical protein